MTAMSAEAGIAASSKKNDRHYPGWSDRAMRTLLNFVADSEAPFRCEDVRRANPDLEAVTASIPGWGSILTAAARAGKIVKVGAAPSDSASNHNANVQMWVRPDLLPTPAQRIVEELRGLSDDEQTAIFDAVLYGKPLVALELAR